MMVPFLPIASAFVQWPLCVPATLRMTTRDSPRGHPTLHHHGRRALKHTHRSPALPLDANSTDENGHLRGRGSLHLHGFEDSSDALTSTDTHRDQRILASDAAQFVEGLDCQYAARRADGMTQGDPTAVGVGAIQRQVQIPHYSKRLCGKGLIELDHIHILDAQPSPFEYLPHCRNRPDAHVFRFYSGMRIGDQSP